MPRNFISQIVCDAEPMLGHVSRGTTRPSWLPAYALQVRAVDTTRWQTRGARGFSWYRHGKVLENKGMVR